jgi:hypothetical protein
MTHRTDSKSLRPSSAVALGVAAAAAIALAPAAAFAQQPPPAGDPNAQQPPPSGYAPPPAGYAPPPAGYAPPPAGYAPPPGGTYYPPPGGYAAPPGPRVIDDWDEGQPIPPGYYKSTKIRTGLVVGGAVTFGAVYLITALTGAVVGDICVATNTTSCTSAKLLLIPVAGPFTLLGAGVGATADLFLVIDGLAQAGGIAMFIAGLAAPRTVLKRNDVGKVTLTPKPITFGTHGGGFGLTGTF